VNLPEKQKLFTPMSAMLILKATQLGFRVVWGDAHRYPAQSAAFAASGDGVDPSCHNWCIAIDIGLFDENDNYLQDSADYEELGIWWEQQHPLCRWGGRFKDEDGNPAPDGGHFSFTHRGVS
jgi:hypothetical protein